MREIGHRPKVVSVRLGGRGERATGLSYPYRSAVHGARIDKKLSMFVSCCPITGSQQLPEKPRLPGEVPDDV